MVAAQPPELSETGLGEVSEDPGPGSRTGNLSALVTRQAGDRPDHIALVEPGVRAVSWAELETQVDRLAGGLVATGLVAGQRIGLDGPNSIAWVVGYLAALRAGLVVVPCDPRAETDERDELLAVTGARAVLTTRTPSQGDRLPSLDLSTDGLVALAERHAAVATPPDAERLAVLAVTQGTSDDPKIVMLSHRALLAHVRQVSGYGIVDEDSVVLGMLPFFHAYGLNAVLGTSLAAGARLVIPDDAWDLASLIEAENIDNLPVTPGLIYRLVQEDGVAARLRGVRTVIVGGAALPWRLGKRFTELTGIRVERGYGLTEAAPGVTSTVGGEILGPFHVGRPLPGVQVRVGDGSEDGGESREPAEIAVRGPNLFSGYWPDAAGGPDEDGWFLTGDIGYESDGELFLIDRTREVIAVRGFSVYPSEVEQQIRQLAEVEAVAVVARPAGSGGGLVAFVAGPEVTEGLVRDFVQAALPVFKRPREVRVVADLPRGVTGAVRRDQLRHQLEQETGS